MSHDRAADLAQANKTAEEGASDKRPLHEFQKLCLTEELRTKALRMHDWKVLSKLTVGDLVANELKYHAMCLVIFRRHFKTDTAGTKTCHQDTCNKAIEAVLAMIEFKGQCQETSVPDGLKFLVGMITRGPSSEETVTETQATLSIAQLVFFNTTTKATNANRTETPLPVCIGLYVHSRFRSGEMVDELARRGLSVNYRCVMYLEKKMGLSVIQQFADEGVVCPPGLRRGLFTVGATDNIDHTSSSTTSAESFHGTAISLFQARTTMDDGQKRDITVVPSGHGQISLPVEYTTIMPLTAGMRCPLPERPETTFRPNNILEVEQSKEEEWAATVAAGLLDEDQEGPTWSAHHAVACSQTVPSLDGLFPLFSQSSTDPLMILHAMRLVRTSIEHLNPGQIPVITGDQPIFAMMKKLQWSHPDSVRNMIVMLGGFHTEEHGLKAIGNLLEVSGWPAALVEAGISNVFLCIEEVFAPRHRMHGRAAGQPIPTFADGYQV